MRKSRFTQEQMVAALREVDRTSAAETVKSTRSANRKSTRGASTSASARESDLADVAYGVEQANDGLPRRFSATAAAFASDAVVTVSAAASSRLASAE